MNINEVLKRPEYRFFKDEVFMTHPIMFLTFGGSIAYGTNTPASDIDIRGCALASKSDLLGMTSFDHFLDEATDTTVYASRTLIKLLAACNPNTIEMLGCKEDTYTSVSPAGKLLLENKKLFLSQRAIDSFGGYAYQQFNRLQNAVAHDRLSQNEQEEHLLHACERAIDHMNGTYTELPEGSIRLYTDQSEKTGRDLEIFADISLKHYPLRDFSVIYNELQTLTRSFAKLNNRNKKKDISHLAKHMMHLMRLYLMLDDILARQEIATYREKEHDFLMDIRNGKYMTEDGLVRQEFYDMLEAQKTKCDQDAKNTDLPLTPDAGKLNELSMSIHELALQ